LDFGELILSNIYRLFADLIRHRLVEVSLVTIEVTLVLQWLKKHLVCNKVGSYLILFTSVIFF